MGLKNNNAFVCHANTFQGIASNEVMTDKPFNLIHADAATTIVITYSSGPDLTIDLGVGEDIDITGAVAVSSTASVKIS